MRAEATRVSEFRKDPFGDDRLKVLYVSGWGRSGSTVLGRIIGQVEGFLPVGELRYIWDRGLIEDRSCGCGARFGACAFWTEVLDRAFEGRPPDPRRLVGLREGGLRTRHLLLPKRAGSLAKTPRVTEYARALQGLYEAVRDVGNSRVIVDTSKFPSHAYLLGGLPGIDLRVVHLVRDPRAVAHSWVSRRKQEPDRPSGETMASHGLVESSLVWNGWNMVASRAPGRHMTLRYEDFVADPRSAVRGVLRFAGEDAEVEFEDGRTIFLGRDHTFSGNPNRFDSGATTITSDEAWKAGMGIPRQLAVSALAWPGMLRYGYPLWPQWVPSQRGERR